MIAQLQLAIDYFGYLFLNEIPCKCWVAGGAVRDYFSLGYITTDIDIYFPSDEEFQKGKIWFIDNGGEIKFENERLMVIYYKKHKFELIKMFFESPQQTIDQFDFTVCCGAISKDSVFFHNTFFIDLAKKRLVVNNLPYPLSTLQRLQKYIKKGFTICNGGLLEIAKAIQKLDLDNPSINHIEKYPAGTPKFVRLD
ncbi:MAG: hypothetical protein AB1472_07050 [Candidatus Omnitrophota bacterium]